jgi:hypothetical protein
MPKACETIATIRSQNNNRSSATHLFLHSGFRFGGAATVACDNSPHAGRGRSPAAQADSASIGQASRDLGTVTGALGELRFAEARARASVRRTGSGRHTRRNLFVELNVGI